MKELYELKDKLNDELKQYGKKEMSAGSLDVIDKLTHTIKNLDKIIENHEEYSNYSGRYMGDNYDRYSYEDSYARGRGRNANRDYRGRYSSEGYSRGYSYDEEMIHELKELMESAPNEKTKQEFRRFIQKIESM